MRARSQNRKKRKPKQEKKKAINLAFGKEKAEKRSWKKKEPRKKVNASPHSRFLMAKLADDHESTPRRVG